MSHYYFAGPRGVYASRESIGGVPFQKRMFYFKSHYTNFIGAASSPRWTGLKLLVEGVDALSAETIAWTKRLAR